MVFVEKLADMFGNIAERLPQYKEHIGRLQSRRNNDRGDTMSLTRLLGALSYVYADIIQFCQDACRIFSTKRKGSSELEVGGRSAHTLGGRRC